MKRILVAPLDWGLGHATRCIPVIKKFIAVGCDVWIGGNGESLELLRKEFPNLKTVTLPGYNPKYPSAGSMVWRMLRQLPGFITVIREEHRQIEKIVNENKIALIISDNRYGLWSRQVPCVFITHQSNILMPKRFGWLQNFVRYFNHRQMKKFTACWIPDFPAKQSLAGELIEFGTTPRNAFEFIGALTRFQYQPTQTTFQVLVILSGPEPQRSILEDILIPQLQKSHLSYFVVLGKVSQTNSYNDPNIVSFLTSSALQEKILTAEIVISRSGYSSVMDLSALHKKAIFIPTPGQTEQEYLAKVLEQKKIAFSMDQKSFDLKTAIAESKKYNGFSGLPSPDDLLDIAVKKILTINKPSHQHA
jgi:uncharacterized protein (TIGR00661 family)